MFNRTVYLMMSLTLITNFSCKKEPSQTSTKTKVEDLRPTMWLVSSSDPERLRHFFDEFIYSKPTVVEHSESKATIMVEMRRFEAQRYKQQGFDVHPVQQSLVTPKNTTVRQQAMEGCTYREPEPNTFCGYTQSIARCDQTISEELQDLANTASFAEVVDLGATHEGRELLGIRIGNLTESSEMASPQVVVVGTQHGNEVITAEMSMRLIRYFYNGYANNTDGIQNLLQDRTLTIVPVANPDGYDYWHQTGIPLRYNRNPCMGVPGAGVDLNRNHAFDWALGIGSVPYSCDVDTAGGLAADSEPETQGLNALIGHDTSILPGNYKTGVVASLHSLGGIIGYPPGVDAQRSVCGLEHASVFPTMVQSKANCTPPDHDILNAVFGTQRPGAAFLKREDLNNRIPYDNGSKGRVFNYGASGSMVNTVVYGPLAGTTPRALSALIELTKDTCFSQDLATNLAPDQLDVMESDAVALTMNMLQAVPDLVDGTYLSDQLGHKFALPHIYRIKEDVEHPKLRFGLKNEVVNPQVQAPSGYVGTSQQDITIDGVHYKTWYWTQDNPDDVYIYPNELKLCVNEGACATVLVDDGPVDLCSQSGWTVTGWAFIGRQTTAPSNQCYWKLTNNPGILTRRKVDLTQMRRSRLVYSYSLDWDTAGSSKEMRVYVSNNGFVNCSTEEGTGCRLIETYYEANNDGRVSEANTLRTEMFDVSDFDGEDKVQVRFVVNNGNDGAASLYDVHFSGWKKE